MTEVPSTQLSPPSERSILVSVAFWLCLLSSAALFASVSLAPRLVEWHELQLSTIDRQQQLELHVQHLEKVVHALEHDPHFREEVARREIGDDAGDHSIPLDKSLTVDMTAPRTSGPNVPLVVPWYIPILKTLAVPSDWRRRVLWISAGLCLIAFVGLRDRDQSSE